MYREVIEHPDAIPPELKQHLDLTSGRDRGRIYRAVPDKFQARPSSQLGKATVAELVTPLEHRNGWHRDTAARLLFERQESAGVAAACNVCQTTRITHSALHLLHALKNHHRIWSLLD